MRNALSLPALVVLALAGAALGSDLPADPSVVLTEHGLLSGRSIDGVRVYLGIPCAAPPTSDLRWRPPRPPAAWDGVRPCTEFGAACPQPAGYREHQAGLPPQSEDCLTLNVWTAAAGPSEARPVMVWIHGGGFTIGASSMPYYDGAALARRGAVVVTINDRLGVFGNPPRALAVEEADLSLSDAMQRYWLAFAATGVPRVEGLPEWPVHEAATDRHLEFGTRIAAGSGLYARECDLLTRVRR